MDENRNSRHTCNLILRVIFIFPYLLLTGGTDYFFKPKSVGQRVQMHTLLVFLSIIGDLQFFGILGVIFGPLVVTGFLTLTDIYHTSYRNLVEPSKT
jgi:predicted PurR-regulated permease PerM